MPEQQLSNQDISEMLGLESADKIEISISASLIKKWWDYSDSSYCGIVLRDTDVTRRVPSIPSDRMLLGQYFEYLCTGALNRDGSTPPMPQTSTGKPTAEAKRMEQQAANFKLLAQTEGLEIYETGKVLQLNYPEMNYRVKGVLDIFGTIKGEPCIVDIKSSGLIGNQWEEYGWEENSFNLRNKLTIQVVFYKYLALKVLGVRDMPFYFLIHSTTNDVDYEFWQVNLYDFDYAMAEIEKLIESTLIGINQCMEKGFIPKPNMKRCKKCPLLTGCIYSRLTPERKVVYIDGIYSK